jgi:hypothetical protein
VSVSTDGRAKNSLGEKHTSREVSQKPLQSPMVSRRSQGTAFTPRAAQATHMGMGSSESRQRSQPNVPQRLQVNVAGTSWCTPQAFHTVGAALGSAAGPVSVDSMR